MSDLHSDEWKIALLVLGAVAPGMQACRDRSKPMTGGEFVDVANEVVGILAVFLLDDDAPPVGVFCLDGLEQTDAV